MSNNSVDLDDVFAFRSKRMYDDTIPKPTRREYQHQQPELHQQEYEGAPAWMYTVIVMAAVMMCSGGCLLLWWMAI